MQYRPFRSLDIKVSALGFGAMRLPLKDPKDPATIDEAAAIDMMSYAFDNGINYIDTAWPYHAGKSEVVVGKAVNNGYRDNVFIADKMPTWKVQCTDDFDKILNLQIERLGVEYIDFYMLHCLNIDLWTKMQNLGALEWAERTQAAGRIRSFGFSFHDDVEVFESIVDAYDWEFAQIQYNYMNETVQAGTRGLEYAASKGLDVIVMEPLLGGRLVNLPEQVQQVWRDTGLCRTPADASLQWLWNRPEVSLVLSGMSDMQQTRENIASAADSGIGRLTHAELEAFAKVREAWEALNPLPCTKCGYCLPCPAGIDIPLMLELYNGSQTLGGSQALMNKTFYRRIPESEQAGKCTQCCLCVEKCPQGIEITDWMAIIQETFEQ